MDRIRTFTLTCHNCGSMERHPFPPDPVCPSCASEFVIVEEDGAGNNSSTVPGINFSGGSISGAALGDALQMAIDENGNSDRRRILRSAMRERLLLQLLLRAHLGEILGDSDGSNIDIDILDRLFREAQEKELPKVSQEDFKKLPRVKVQEACDCSICQTAFDKDEDAVELFCHHKFHEDCIENWIVKMQGTCPTCRVQVTFPKGEIKEK